MHIEDSARRLAVDGFIAVVPDTLTKLAGYPSDKYKARALFGQLDQMRIREDFITATAYALALPGGLGKLGAVGFCYGGGCAGMGAPVGAVQADADLKYGAGCRDRTS